MIRAAKSADLDILCDFQQELVDAERPFDPTIKEGKVIYYDIAELIGAANVGIFVAEINTEVVGCGYAKLVKSKDFLKHSRHAYLGFMYVKPEYRGQGVNSKVMETLKAWSLSHGVTEIRLEVYAQNNAALKAYLKSGFKPHVMEMRMEC